jgi:selenocysteine lyase/cysteine desulfurase
MTALAWRARVGTTWLGHPSKRMRMHNRVSQWLAAQRKLDASQFNLLGPIAVDSAYDVMLELGDRNQWFACTTLSAQLGELVLCAPSGEILSSIKDREWQRRVNEDGWRAVQAINAVRNVVCHPGSRCVPEVCSQITTYDREHLQLATTLDDDWSHVRSRPFAEYALLKMNAAGEQVIARYGI